VRPLVSSCLSSGGTITLRTKGSLLTGTALSFARDVAPSINMNFLVLSEASLKGNERGACGL
jgi:hypothetical protein